MESLNILDFLAIIRRHKLAFALAALAVFAGAAGFAATWSRYTSTATIQIQQPDIPQEMTAPLGVTPNQMIQALADQRIQRIEETVTSSASLVDIITRLGLYPGDRRRKPIVDLVEGMRKAIKLDMVSAGAGGASAAPKPAAGQVGSIAFTISFTYSNPAQAQQTTNELMSRFLDEDLKRRRQQADTTTNFLAGQVAALEASMAEQERKISDFTEAHAESRPDSLAFNQQMEATTALSLQDVERQMEALQKTRGDLQAQLAGVDPYSRVVADGQLLTTPAIQLKALQARYTTMLGQYGSEHPDVLKLRHQIEALQGEQAPGGDATGLRAQITDLRTNLAAAERTLGPDHPDVKSLRQQLAAAKQQAASALPARPSGNRDADNPAYLMLVSQMNATNQQYQALSGQRDRLQQQHDRYAGLIAATPAVQKQLAELSRDYDNAQLRYRELKERKMGADMNQQMEQGREAERLVVIDPPELPTGTHPSRLLIVAAGGVMAMFAGLAAVMLAESMTTTIHGARHLAEVTGIMPLVAIPHIFTREERRARRWLMVRAFVGLLIIAGGGAWALDRYVMPLDVVVGMVMLRLGVS